MTIKKWEPDNFELEMNTVWSFPKRGDWATHDAKYRKLVPIYHKSLLRHTKQLRYLLDQFACVKLLLEAKLLIGT